MNCTCQIQASLKEEYMRCLAHLLTLKETDRSFGLKSYCRDVASSQFRCAVLAAENKEREHVLLVRRCMRTLGDSGNLHDWSKNAYFFFITNGLHVFGIEEADMCGELDRVIQAHYRREAHHPQYEALNLEECTNADIREMAVDRCCREISKNNGDMDGERMKKFLPVFTYDHETKMNEYIKQVAEVGPLVREAYDTFTKQRVVTECEEALLRAVEAARHDETATFINRMTCLGLY